jgi:hypothetical protein
VILTRSVTFLITQPLPFQFGTAVVLAAQKWDITLLVSCFIGGGE